MNLLGDIILIIVAHPDDAEIGMGGTVRKLIEKGNKVVVAVYALSQPSAIRYEEACKGIGCLGAELNIMSMESRQVADVEMKQVVSDIDNLIKKYKPDTVFTHSKHDMHYDHRIIHDAVISSSRIANYNIIEFEAPDFHAITDSRLRLNLYIDISGYEEIKYQAIKKHESQERVQNFLDFYRLRDKLYGEICRKKSAEGFFISKIIIN